MLVADPSWHAALAIPAHARAPTIPIHHFTALRASFARLVAAEEPKARIANILALVLAWNTPFYPLYVLAAAGPPASSYTLLNLAVLPIFAAVPLVTRRHALLGRALLVVAGTLNTMLCIWLYGEPAGAQLFLLPCITLAIMLFHRHERLVMGAVLALPILAYAMLGHYGTPPLVYSAAQYRHLLSLNAASVGTLTAFLAWTFAGLP